MSNGMLSKATTGHIQVQVQVFILAHTKVQLGSSGQSGCTVGLVVALVYFGAL